MLLPELMVCVWMMLLVLLFPVLQHTHRSPLLCSHSSPCNESQRQHVLRQEKLMFLLLVISFFLVVVVLSDSCSDR